MADLRDKIPRIPLLTVFLGVVAGIVLFSCSLPWWTVIILGCIVPMLYLFKLSQPAIIAASALIGWTAAYINAPYKFSRPPKDIVYKGVITSAYSDADCQRFAVDVDYKCDSINDIPVKPFRVEVRYPAFYPHVEVGDIVRFSGSYSLPERLIDLPYEDDLKSAFRNRGISLRCYVPKLQLEITGRSDNPFYAVRRWQRSLGDILFASDLNEQTAIFLSAILLGDDTGIASVTRDNFSSAGVAHMLALSGAHLAVIAAILGFIFLPLAIVGMNRVRWLCILIGLWVFVVITGMSDSVVRSALMVSSVLVAMMFGRPRSSLNFLCLAAITILIVAPIALFRDGFQLSFMATLAIILMANRLNPFDPRKRSIWIIAGVFSVTIAATLGTLPLAAWHFHRVPLLFIPANLIAVVVLPALIVGGFLLLSLLSLGFKVLWLCSLLDFINMCFQSAVDWIASFRMFSIRDLWFEPWLLIPAYLTIASLFLWCYRKNWLYGLLSLSLMLLTVAAGYMSRPAAPDRELFITRDLHHTVIVAREGDKLTYICDFPARSADALQQWNDRFRGYIVNRGVRNIVLKSNILSESTDIIHFAGKSFKMATATHSFDQHTDYCIANRLYKGKISDLASKCNADTILLTADMNLRRRNRYVRELDALGKPFKNLRDSVFVIVE